LMDAMRRFEGQTWNPFAIRRHAQRYDIHLFQERLLDFLNRVSPAVQNQSMLRRRAG